MSERKLTERPAGSNADEWHLFLSEHLDNRAGSDGLTYMAVQVAEAIEVARSKQEMFEVESSLKSIKLAVSFNPHGRFHGWLFRQHPDGQYVSVRRLNRLLLQPSHND